MIERGGGRPAEGYRIDGKRVPGTTTVIGRFKDATGLLGWTWYQALNEQRLRRRAVNDGVYRRARAKDDKMQKAGQLGNYVHDAIEFNIHGTGGAEYFTETLELEGDDLVKCQHAYAAYEKWRAETDIEILATEVAMVSEEFRFGGTLDATAVVDGELVLLDWKTSNGVYNDYIVQLGAYALLWHETRGEAPEGAQLLRFSKDTAEFEHHTWDKDTLRKGAEQFLLFRKAYEIDKQLKKAV